jgi:murein DD-endopeptidase MepM/ murein hydrolase activator NlpD
MLDQDQSGKDMSDYSKFVIDQYKDGDVEGSVNTDLSDDSLNRDVVMERIAFLEQKVEEMKENHASVLDSIRYTTRGKIVELENIIQATGLNAKTLAGKIEKEQDRLASRRNAANGSPQGGPFHPVEEERLLEYDAALHSDLKQMMVLQDAIDRLPLAHPMNTNRITSGYGMRIDPFRHRLARHTGIDFVGGHGAPIFATNNGIVKEAGRRSAYGIAAEIDHGLGVSTLYGHMSRVVVKEGQHVKKGQIVGYQGSTGRSTGSHLHYEVRYYDKPVNPKNFLEAGKHVRTTKN